MKRDKKWLINELGNIASGSLCRDFAQGYNGGINRARGLVEKLDELEIPTIPSFADGFIKETGEGTTVIGLMKRALLDEDSDLAVWLVKNETYREDVQNQKDFVLAYFGGKYKVEKEKKYLVEDNQYTLLCKFEGKVISTHKSGNVDLPIECLEFELTEKEIKDYDPRYLPFAKLVEESP